MNNHVKMDYLDTVLTNKNIEAIFLKDLSNINFFSEFEPTVKNRQFGLLYTKDQCIFIAPSTSYNDVVNNSTIKTVERYVEYPSVKYKHSIIEVVLDYFGKNLAIQSVGIEGDSFTYTDMKQFQKLGIQFQDITKELMDIRSIKPIESLTDLKLIAEVSKEMIDNCLKVSRTGISEIEIDKLTKEHISFSILEKFENPKFDIFTMTTAGANRTVLPHTTSSYKTIEDGDLLLYCRQIRVNHLRIQCDRMGFSKNVSVKEKHYYQIVLEALHAAIRLIKVGIEVRTIDLKIREIFKKYNVDEYYLHRSGASLGIDMAETPLLTFSNTDILQEGMVLVIQPALYIPDVGGFRCSDTVYVTKNSTILLTDYPREIEQLLYE